jgi:hypothetical protein
MTHHIDPDLDHMDAAPGLAGLATERATDLPASPVLLLRP